MSYMLQIVLIAGSLLTFLYVLYRIRKAQFQIQDSIFWVLVFLYMFIMGAFPYLIYFISALLGFDTPLTFVLVSIIFILLIKVFFQSFQISKMNSKINDLAQQIALDKHERESNKSDELPDAPEVSDE